jgi:4'-phosphopantetheinyl transferase
VSWERRAGPIDLRAGDVHVWRAALDVSDLEYVRLARALSPDEVCRALRLRTAPARRHFVVARGILRLILSRYLAVHPAALRFADGGHGKPVLAGVGAAGPHFNVSHSGSLALYALSTGGPVGVDVEHVRLDLDWEEPAALFLSRREDAALRELPPSDRRASFFSCWTRKEAILKARGDGLQAPLDAFDVSVGLDSPAALLAVRGEMADNRPWWLHDCHPAGDHVAAVAGAWRLERLERLEWAG